MEPTELKEYREIFDNLYDAMYCVDLDRKITYWNSSAEKLTGYHSVDVVGKSCSDNFLIHVENTGDNLCIGMFPLAATLTDGIKREAEVYLHHRDGHRLPVMVHSTPIKKSDGNIVGAIEMLSDNSQKVAAMQRIQELEVMALIDPLTGLANRRYTEMNLCTKSEELNQYGWPYGVLMIDIDHFKRVNDKYGHDVGDEVLKAVANTLHRNIRSHDLAGRWGGEEFLVIINAANAVRLQNTAEKLRILVEQSAVSNAGEMIQVTVSIGAVLAKMETAESLVKRADQLLYQSKGNGRNMVSLEGSISVSGKPDSGGL
jgi:diguanylate cyclase (GGDEF)-like protein/PAS domain S-box-containing protein